MIGNIGALNLLGQIGASGGGVGMAGSFVGALNFDDWGSLPIGAVQYAEDFGSIGANWDITNQGGLVIGNDGDASFFNENSLRLPQAASGRIILKNSVFSQADMVVTLRWHRAASAGAGVRLSDLMLGVRCADNSDGYWLTNDASGNEFIRLIKRVAGVNTVLQGDAQVNSGSVPGAVMLSIVGIAKGNHIAFLIFGDNDFTDLRLAINIYDSSIASGSIGIGGFNAAVREEFADDVAVYNYSAPVSYQWKRASEFFGMFLAPSSSYGSAFSGDVVVMHKFVNARDWTNVGVVNRANVRATMRVSENAVRLTAELGLRLDANGDGYWAGTDINTSVGVRVLKRVAGVFTELGETPNLGFPTINTEYKIEFSADGTSLQVRILTAADAVLNLGSGNYDLTVIDATFAAAGEIGVGRAENNGLQIVPTARTCMKDITFAEL